ncbi:hypothetical protein K505DRAFT_359137 [Melanomma pulvis-pyrius CBS 109.77]|uniref:Uncharacterized protein n=1 Tax=Melanomma pulvis-pyrius CBS 109.77 TaxID=1314802 RepID=A0A6A6XKM5_9PLEO|nr:hypothetical protein K505DRAFT_359137 [Melanomma pulvis-pyrius CBS 109.77]
MSDYQRDDDFEQLFAFNDYGEDNETNEATTYELQPPAPIHPQPSITTVNIQSHPGSAHILEGAVTASESGAFSNENGDAFSNWPSPPTDPRIEPLQQLPVYAELQDNQNISTPLYAENGLSQWEHVSSQPAVLNQTIDHYKAHYENEPVNSLHTEPVGLPYSAAFDSQLDVTSASASNFNPTLPSNDIMDLTLQSRASTALDLSYFGPDGQLNSTSVGLSDFTFTSHSNENVAGASHHGFAEPMELSPSIIHGYIDQSFACPPIFDFAEVPNKIITKSSHPVSQCYQTENRLIQDSHAQFQTGFNEINYTITATT